MNIHRDESDIVSEKLLWLCGCLYEARYPIIDQEFHRVELSHSLYSGIPTFSDIARITR